MTLESIEKLREYADVRWEPWAAARERLHEMLDAVEAEIAERYMELPCDAYDVPIRPDDIMSCTAFDTNDFDGKEHVMAVGNAFWVDKDGYTHNPSETLHVKPDPLIALLDEFATDIANYKHDGVDFDTYAERIRELLGVEP